MSRGLRIAIIGAGPGGLCMGIRLKGAGFEAFEILEANITEHYDTVTLPMNMDPDDPEAAIAVGFLRSGPWEHTGMSVAAETRQRVSAPDPGAQGLAELPQQLVARGVTVGVVDPLEVVEVHHQYAER